MDKNEYSKKISKKTLSSDTPKNCVRAFVSGGIICTIGQIIMNLYTYFGMTKENSATMTSITLIFISVLLTGLDLYHKGAKFAGAGTLVPITGFANAMSSPAIEAKTEGFVLGVGVKLFSIAGPVIAYGIFSSFIAGILIYLFRF